MDENPNAGVSNVRPAGRIRPTNCAFPDRKISLQSVTETSCSSQAVQLIKWAERSRLGATSSEFSPKCVSVGKEKSGCRMPRAPRTRLVKPRKQPEVVVLLKRSRRDFAGVARLGMHCPLCKLKWFCQPSSNPLLLSLPQVNAVRGQTGVLQRLGAAQVPVPSRVWRVAGLHPGFVHPPPEPKPGPLGFRLLGRPRASHR